MEPKSSSESSSTGLDENVAGLLCYLFGFITGIVFLVLEKRSAFVRFHAMQSTFAFLGLFVLSIVSNFLPVIRIFLPMLVGIATLVVWVLMMVKAFQGERYKLPIVGDMAEGQVEKGGA